MKEEKKDNFNPFGVEWENYVLKMPKKEIMKLYKNRCLEVIKLRKLLETL